ncbi:hypothetical protein [Streptomyces sp. DSM 40907]|uniref:hypothetical protein n=1 Tax=Streptomyces kutzneri TaxID=3051179 RepID=UPI0028D58B17|nr:hypothetical protein [Streptomyces sp. DSM 40907]
MTISEDVSREAGEQLGFVFSFIDSDVHQQRLHYHLLRLASYGLAQEEVEDLRELGRLAFEDADVTEQSAKIKQRAGASALAVAIADIVERGGPRPQVMMGAVLGAYAGLRGIPSMDRSTMAVLGAIGGAIATVISPIVFERIEVVGLERYLSAPH